MAGALVVELIDEGGETGVTVVELVVAEGEGVEAKVRHHLGVGGSLEKRVVGSAGQCIASMELEDVGSWGVGYQLVCEGDEAWKATVRDAGGGGGGGEAGEGLRCLRGRRF